MLRYNAFLIISQVINMPLQLTLLLWMLALLFITGILFSTKLFSFMDKDTSGRIHRIDGLRFFLAFMVAFHHFVLSYEYFHGHPWLLSSLNDYPVNQKIGSFGVALFFMVSGYVFAHTNVKSWFYFYKKRVLRIAPLFMLSSTLCLAIAFWIQRHEISTNDLLSKFYFWFDAGLTGKKPDVFGMPDTQFINAGVTWTLFWEWAFYFSLPVAYVLRDKIGLIPIASAIIFASVYFVSTQNPALASYASFFAIGAIGKELTTTSAQSKTFYNIGASLSFAVVILISDSSFNIYFMPAVASTFFFIAIGGDFFGLLNIKGFIRLGDASYSIYMLHGIAWFCMNRFIQSHNFHLDQTQYMVVSGTVFLFFLIACSLSYKFVELPFINLGKKS